MYRCGACRTAFLFPVPPPQALAAFYDTFHHSDQAGGVYDQFEARMQADFPAKVALVLKSTAGQPGRLLDVGCGKGFFVRACVDRGIDAEGVDLSASGVAYARERLGVRAACGDLSEIKGQLGEFDTVTFWATIEHLPDPVRTLRDIYGVLKPGGRLFLDTGIGDDWLDRMLPGVAQWYDPPQHLFVFSREGMSRTLAAAGFQLVGGDYCFERSARRRVGRRIRAAVAATGFRLVAGTTRVRQGEFAMTRFPLGNLMSVVARKPVSGEAVGGEGETDPVAPGEPGAAR